MIPTVTFIACHAGPAEHFATFAEELTKRGHTVQIYACGPALDKFTRTSLRATGFDIKEENVTERIASACQPSTVVVTDLAHPIDEAFQRTFQARDIRHLTYYDNPEPFVPGGYSSQAARVIELADGVLIANANLTRLFSEPGKEIDLTTKVVHKLGFYPAAKAEIIASKRKPEENLWVYLGGNNSVYFDEAFPAFLKIIEESELPEGTRILLQQHPGAKEKNLDVNQIPAHLKERFIISTQTTDEALLRAERVFYYQTSMGPLVALAGIPAVQIGHEPFEDILVRSGIAPAVTEASQLKEALESRSAMDPRLLKERLGIRADWPERLEKALYTTTPL